VLVVILFWGSPVVYSFRNIHEALGGSLLEQLYLLNPITVAVVAFQRATWLGGANVQQQFADKGINPLDAYPADLDLRLIIVTLIGLVFLWFAHRVFSRLQGNFAQEI